jgi:transposase
MPKPGMYTSTSRTSEVSPPPRTRRRFSPADKLRIVKEADACRERGQIEALLRREGIYSSHLAAWRKAIKLHSVEGLGAVRAGRKRTRDEKDARMAALESKNARLEKELERTKALLELQKKVSEILSVELPTPEKP